MKDNIFSDKEAREKLVRGVDKVCDAVKGTLGAAGYDFIQERFEYPGHSVSNDGVTLARNIVLEDPIENIGANICKEIASRSDKQGGDGTTTALTLAQAIIHEGMKVDAHPKILKKSLEDCYPIIEAAIKDQTKEITVHEVGKVAAISAEDEKMGALIQEIYEKIGKEGILYPDVSKTFEDSYTLGEGVKIEGAGYVSPYMCDMEEKTGQLLNVAQLKNPHILITKQKITSLKRDLEPIMALLASSNNHALVVFCDEYEPMVIADAFNTRMKKDFRTIIIKLPTIWKDHWYEDLQKMTGATMADGTALQLRNVKVAHLGTVGSLLVDKSDTFLDGIKDISAHVKELEQGDDDSKIRAARLNTKTARLFIGAHSDAALSAKRDKLEDARNSAWQALHGGIVPGGGVALRNVAEYLAPLPGIGPMILMKALKAPMQQILLNAGVKDTPENFEVGPNGYDVKTDKEVDMFEAGIVDPATVVLSSVRNALSVAATVLSAKVVVTMPKQEAPQRPML